MVAGSSAVAESELSLRQPPPPPAAFRAHVVDPAPSVDLEFSLIYAMRCILRRRRMAGTVLLIAMLAGAAAAMAPRSHDYTSVIQLGAREVRNEMTGTLSTQPLESLAAVAVKFDNVFVPAAQQFFKEQILVKLVVASSGDIAVLKSTAPLAQMEGQHAVHRRLSDIIIADQQSLAGDAPGISRETRAISIGLVSHSPTDIAPLVRFAAALVIGLVSAAALALCADLIAAAAAVEHRATGA